MLSGRSSSGAALAVVAALGGALGCGDGRDGVTEAALPGEERSPALAYVLDPRPAPPPGGGRERRSLVAAADEPLEGPVTGGSISRDSLRTVSSITFEGFAQRQDLTRTWIAGARFEGWQTLIDFDETGEDGGMFANEPTPSTIAYWVCTGPPDAVDKCEEDYARDVVFRRPVSKVFFFYTAAPDPNTGLSTVTMEAYSPSGQMIGSVVKPANMDWATWTATPGDAGLYNKWDPIEIEFQDNLIASVKLRGSPNRTGIDSYEFVALNYPPVAVAGGPYSVTEGEAVKVSGRNSYDPVDSSGAPHPNGDPIVLFAWDMGDGTTSTAIDSTFTHTYAESGSYTATLTVKDPNGVWSSSSASTTVVVDNAPPTPDGGPDVSVPIGDAVTLNGSFTDPGTEADDSPWTWTIEWGDSSDPETGQLTSKAGTVSRTHTYAQPGVYTAKFHVMDADGGTGVDEVKMTVTNAPPTASFTVPATRLEGTAIAFDGSGSSDPEGGTLTHAWTFGDGATSTAVQPSHAYADNGDYTVTLTVTDPYTSTGQKTETVAVQNVAPTATFSAPSGVQEGDSFELSLTNPSDPSPTDAAAGFSHSFDCGGGTLVAASGSSVTCTTAVDEGTLAVRGEIRDKDGGRSTYTASVPVSNVAPTLIPGVGGTVAENGTFALPSQFSDPGKNDSWTYTVDWGDGSPATTGQITSWASFMSIPATHQYSTLGTFTVQVSVSDGTAPPATGSLTVSVVRPNGTPTANAGGPYSVPEGGSVSFDWSATDPDGDPLTYTWDFGDGSAHETGNAPAAVSHTYGQSGTYTATVTVNDGNGGTATSSATVTVTNTAPVVDPITDLTSVEGVAWSTSVSFSDPGTEDEFTASVDYGSGPVTLNDVSSPFAIGTSYAATGNYTVTVTVSDGEETSAPRTFVVTVVAANSPPTADAGGPYSAAEGGTVTFDGSGTDPDGDPLTYSWTFGDGNTGSGPSPSHAYDQDGTYTATLTVSDGKGSTATAAATVEVANLAPVISPIGNVDAVQNVQWTQQVSFADPGADSWMATVDFGAGPGAPFSVTSPFDVSHTYSSPGTYAVAVTVSDGVETAAASFQVVVASPNAPPTAIAGGPYSGTEGSPVQFSGSASDPDNDPLTFSWAFGDGGTASGASASHTYTQNGTYTVTLTVTDARGASATSTTSVTVDNAPPALGALTDITVLPGVAWTKSVGFSDAGANDTWTATVDYGFGPVSLGSVTSPFGLGTTYAAAGTYPVTITVTDDSGGYDSETFQVLVPAPNGAPTVTASASNGGIGECTASGAGSIQLAAQASDPEGDPITFAWFIGPDQIATGASPTVQLPLGTRTVRVVATETIPNGQSATATVDVTIRDTQAPQLALTASPGQLWPPNHRYVPITVQPVAVDACASGSSVLVTGFVVSSEPDNANGDGNTVGDVRVTRPNGTVLLSSNQNPRVEYRPGDALELRAERRGGGPGRTYTITVSAQDPSGNFSGQVATVVVEHDQGRRGRPGRPR